MRAMSHLRRDAARVGSQCGYWHIPLHRAVFGARPGEVRRRARGKGAGGVRVGVSRRVNPLRASGQQDTVPRRGQTAE